MIDHLFELYQKSILPPSQLWSGDADDVFKKAFHFSSKILEDSTGFPLRENSAHPNFLMIEPVSGKTEITVDQVRVVMPFLNSTAILPGYRVLLVKGADTFNRQAANALLKKVEEPPLKTCVILLTQSIGRVLPTLVSRCVRFSFGGALEQDIPDSLMQVFGKCALLSFQKSYEAMDNALLSLGEEGIKQSLDFLPAFLHKVLRSPFQAMQSQGMQKILSLKPYSYFSEAATLILRYIQTAHVAHLPPKDILYGAFLLLDDPALGYSLGMDSL